MVVIQEAEYCSEDDQVGEQDEQRLGGPRGRRSRQLPQQDVGISQRQVETNRSPEIGQVGNAARNPLRRACQTG